MVSNNRIIFSGRFRKKTKYASEPQEAQGPD